MTSRLDVDRRNLFWRVVSKHFLWTRDFRRTFGRLDRENLTWI